MTREELAALMERALGPDGNKFDQVLFERGPKNSTKLLEMVHGDKHQEVKILLASDGRLETFSTSVQICAHWRGLQCMEIFRRLPNGIFTTVKASGQFVSGTARVSEEHSVTGYRELMEEIGHLLKVWSITVTTQDIDFKAMIPFGRTGYEEPPRESTVNLGFRSRRLVYRALLDLSYLDTLPWPKGLDWPDGDSHIYSVWKQADLDIQKAVANKASVLASPHEKDITLWRLNESSAINDLRRLPLETEEPLDLPSGTKPPRRSL